MQTSAKTVEPEQGTLPTTEATVFAASWDVFYQDAQGLECHLQVKGVSLDHVLEQATSASMSITEAGGKPSRRIHGGNPSGDAAKGNGNGASGPAREPTYVDERGARRCNRRLTDGSVCGRPVTEKEGRYGTFWSCPNYKAHAPAPPR